MKHWEKLKLTMSLAALFCCAVLLFGGVAFSATTAPVVTVLPVIKEGSITPTRIAQQSTTGNLFVTDGHAESVLVYTPAGNLRKTTQTPLGELHTAQEPGGVAFAQDGNLLVTQNTYVVVLNPDTGAEIRRFGAFKSAFSIAVDNSATGTGNIFVSDIKNYCVQVFDKNYLPVDVTAGSGHNFMNGSPDYGINFIGDSQIAYFAGPGFFNRPAGVAIEKNTGMLAVVDSLNGKIQFFDQAGNYINEIGVFGYDSSHTAFWRFFTYPQSIAFEYTSGGALDRAYVLDTFQSYVMVVDATNPVNSNPSGDPTQQIPWPWLADIGLYGHHNGDLIVPSDILIDKFDPANNRLVVTNGFGSLSVFGLSSLQPYDVFIDTIGSDRMTIHWTRANSAAITGYRVYRSTDPTLPLSSWTLVGGTQASTATALVDGPPLLSALSQYTTYYYVVRAVTGATESQNISPVSAKTAGLFNLAVSINGNGSVNGTVSCTSGTCNSSPLLAADSVATLTATATAGSVFNGWTGDCFTTSDTCLITMDKAKSVAAFFSARLAFHVDGAYFDNLQDAYNAATANTSPVTVIRVLAGTWPSTLHPTEYMTAWQGKTVVIEGGYDATFTTNAGGSSTVTGRTNLTAGKVIMKQFKLK
jgi:hypothetical protein